MNIFDDFKNELYNAFTVTKIKALKPIVKNLSKIKKTNFQFLHTDVAIDENNKKTNKPCLFFRATIAKDVIYVLFDDNEIQQLIADGILLDISDKVYNIGITYNDNFTDDICCTSKLDIGAIGDVVSDGPGVNYRYNKEEYYIQFPLDEFYWIFNRYKMVRPYIKQEVKKLTDFYSKLDRYFGTRCADFLTKYIFKEII